MTMPTIPNGKDTKPGPLPAPINGAGTAPRPQTALPVDFASLSDEQVAVLAAEAPRELERRKAKLRDELRERARALGVVPEHLLAPQRSRREPPSSTVAPDDGRHFVKAKYRNPKNPSETWSGRGNAPKWYADALAGGTSEEALRIPDGEE